MVKPNTIQCCTTLVTMSQTVNFLFFFNFEILPPSSHYTLSPLLFMIKIEINLWSILRYITLTQGNMLIFTNIP